MPADGTADGAARRERLARRRKALGLTQESLAGLLGVDRSTVARWERGDAAPLPWMQPRLARALKVSADRLEELLTAPGPAGSDAARSAGTRHPAQPAPALLALALPVPVRAVPVRAVPVRAAPVRQTPALTVQVPPVPVWMVRGRRRGRVSCRRRWRSSPGAPPNWRR